MSSLLASDQADYASRCCTLAAVLLQLSAQSLVVIANGRVLAVSPPLLRLLKLPTGQTLCGQPLAAMLPAADRDGVLRRLDALATIADDTELAFSCDLARADQSLIRMQVSATECQEGNRSVTLFRFLPVDDSPEACGTIAGALRNRMDLQRSAVFGDIASAMVHELSQPVTVIHGAGELLRDVLDKNDVPEVARRAAEMIVDAGMQLSARFRRVWEFIRERRFQVQRESLNAVVADAVPLFEATWRPGGGNVELRLEDGLPDVVIDAPLMQLVIVALLTRCARAGARAFRTAVPLKVTTSQPGPGLVELKIEPASAVSSAMVRETSESLFENDERDGPRLDVCRTIVSELGGVFLFNDSSNSEIAGFSVRLPAAD